MVVNKSPRIKKKSTNLTFKLGLLIIEVLLPFGLYGSLTAENMVLSIIIAGCILLGMLLLVIFR